MAFDITLAQFNKIASGDYNAGQIDIKTNNQGKAELVKVNNHVWKTGDNKVVLSPERILEVKEAFLNALQKAGVQDVKMAEIRDRLGIPSELVLPENGSQRDSILQARFTPLTRAQAREIIDTYANYGKGFTDASKREISIDEYLAADRTRNMSASHMQTRDRANMVSMARHQTRGAAGASYGVADYGITDALSLLSTARSLADLGAAQDRREKGANAVNDRLRKRTALINSFQGLVSMALKMLPANVRDSGEFRLAGETVKLVKDDNGSISAIVGKGATATKVKLGMDADTYIARLFGRVIMDMDTLGAPAVKNILGSVYDRDLEGGLVASEKSSLTRHLSALILTAKSGHRV